MKLSTSHLRSMGAVIVCFAMVLCNIPPVLAADIIIKDSVTGPVYGNGTGPLLDGGGSPISGSTGGAPPSAPPADNSVWVTKIGSNTGSVAGEVYGGYAYTGNADSNTVTIDTAVTGNVFGGNAVTGSSRENEVFIYGTVSGPDNSLSYIAGGQAADSAAENLVEIGSGADVTAYITGGATAGGYAALNTVNVVSEGTMWQDSRTAVKGIVSGGQSDSGSVIGNTVNVSAGENGSVNITGNVYGGYTKTGSVTENEVIIGATGGSVHVANAYGMYAETGNAEENLVVIDGGKIGKAYAGYTRAGDASYNTVNAFRIPSIDAINNVVSLSGEVSAVVVDNIYGGATASGDANSNSIVVLEHQRDGVFYGGYTENGDARYNTTIVGGGNFGSFHSGHSDNGVASDNYILTNGGNIRNLYGGSVEKGTTEDNVIRVNHGIIGNVYGGYVTNGTARNNTVTVAGEFPGATVENVYGGHSQSGDAINNEVTIDYDGRVTGNVVGGYSGFVTALTATGTTDNNIVNINHGAVITGNVYGGQSGSANSNRVNINHGTINGTIVGGGDAISGFYAKENNVTIINGSVKDVYGGKITVGDAVFNTIDITGGSSGNIYGGDSGMGHSNDNAVSINNGTVHDVYGGRTAAGNAKNNELSLTSGNIGSVYGGITSSGLSENNSVVIDNSTVNGENISGGSSSHGDALDNIITVRGSQIRNSGAKVIGGNTTFGNANNNLVAIDGGSVNALQVAGGNSGGGNSDGNIVTIGEETGGSFIISDLTGGFSSNGFARNNFVTIGGGGPFSGNFTDVHGGRSGGSGDASNNTVTIYNGVFTNVYGGKADGDGYAMSNKVYLHGGTFNGEIYGGYSTSGSATGNLVDIGAGAILMAGTKLYGGYTSSARHDGRTGNALNIRKPVTITGLNGFGKYNFYLPADFTANKTMIAVTSGDGSNGVINLKDSWVEIGVNEGSSLKKGDTIVLIDEQGGKGFDGSPANSTSNGSTLTDHSGLMNYSFGLSVDGNKLKANVLGKSLSPGTDSFPEGFVSGIILANQGADAIAGAAMDGAMTAANKGPVKGLGGFGSLVAGKSKYQTGSHVDMIGVSASAGLAIGADFTNSRLTLGPFAEYGKGNYDTVQTSAAGQEVSGDGDSQYMGGGFLLRVDFKDTGAGRYFAEASARAGRLENNFSVNWQGVGESLGVISYKTTTPYYGIHLGYGGSWDVASSTALDIYGKYFFAREGEGSASLSGGEAIEFENLTSSRIRGGARVAYSSNDRLALSFGGAYEYEMNGENKASMLGLSINAPSLKGGTGIGEFVIGYRPSEDSMTSISFGIQGYAGKREGITGSFAIRF